MQLHSLPLLSSSVLRRFCCCWKAIEMIRTTVASSLSVYYKRSCWHPASHPFTHSPDLRSNGLHPPHYGTGNDSRRGLQTKYNMWCGAVKECFDNEEGQIFISHCGHCYYFYPQLHSSNIISPSASSSSMLPIMRAIIKAEALIKYHSIVAEFRNI